MTVEAAIEEIKRIGVKHGDIVVLRSDGPVPDDFTKDVSLAIADYMEISVLVMTLRMDEKLETVNEEEMNAHGWYRKP